VTDRETLAGVATVFRDGGWPAEVDDDALTAAYSAQSAGPHRGTCIDSRPRCVRR
jgi:hypothetical protein